MEPKTWDCNNCIHGRHCDESNPAGEGAFELEGIQSSSCFVTKVTEGTYALLKYNRHWVNGRLLAGGGLLEQPAIYMEAMEYIDFHRSRLEEKLARINAEKSRRR